MKRPILNQLQREVYKEDTLYGARLRLFIAFKRFERAYFRMINLVI